MRCPLLTSNGASTSFQHKLIQIPTSHKLRHRDSNLRLLIAKSLDLGLKSPNLVIYRDPLTERLADLVRLCLGVFHLD